MAQHVMDLNEIIVDFGTPEKRKVADIVDKPITVLEVSMHRSGFDTKPDRRYASMTIFMDEGNGMQLFKVNADQPYLLNALDRARCALTRTSDIGGLWWLNIPFTCKVTMLGKFYRLEGIKDVRAEATT